MNQPLSPPATEACLLRVLPGQLGLPGCPRTLNRVLLVVDREPDSKPAIDFAIQLAEHFDSRMTLMHGGNLRTATGPRTDPAAGVPDADRFALLCLLWDIRSRCPDVTLSSAKVNSPEDVWQAAAWQTADLIILPEGLAGRFWSLVTVKDGTEVVSNAPCPVLIVLAVPEQAPNPERVTPPVRPVLYEESRTLSVRPR